MNVRRWLTACCCSFALLSCAGPSAEAQGPPPVPPPDAMPPPPPGGSVPDGQWVFTQQYGWVWMPYDDPYTYVPPGGSGEPLEYVFYVNYGWTWVAAPWVWGYGARPYYGRPGPDRYAWYRHGYWKTPERWRYTPQPEHAEQARHGVRAPPPHAAGRHPPAAQPQPHRQPEDGGRAQARDGSHEGGGHDGGGHAGSEGGGHGGGEREGGGFEPRGAQR